MSVETKSKKAKGSTKKQPDLPEMSGPGVVPINIPEIDKLAEAYQKAKQRRCNETPHEVSTKKKLIEALQAHKDEIGADSNGEIVYRYDDMVVTLKPGDPKLKVKELKEPQIGEE